VLVVATVTEQGEGRVRFKVEDIFTDTLDQQGNPIVGVANARISLQSEAISNVGASGNTNAAGEVTLGPLAPGRYTYRISGPRHEASTGRVFLRPGVTIDEEAFIDYRTVSFTWNVTPTTIPSTYNITVGATFQTLIPAPVVVMSPASINLPDMQVGETISGELTITNHGLIRADATQIELPASDEYFRYQFQGSIPSELQARQSVVLPYSVTALQALPNSTQARSELQDWLQNRAPQRRPDTNGCSSYQKQIRLNFSYACANGVVRPGSAQSAYYVTYGAGCGSPGTSLINVGGGGGGGGGVGFPGGGGGYAPQAPQCAPDCTEGCPCNSGGCRSPTDDDDDPPDTTPPGNDPPKQCD
jgi:large repetitive protein